VAGLQAGRPLAEAVAAASQDMTLDLPAALGLLIQHQAFVECTT
jgi:Flp pilus assembly protein TadB